MALRSRAQPQKNKLTKKLMIGPIQKSWMSRYCKTLSSVLSLSGHKRMLPNKKKTSVPTGTKNRGSEENQQPNGILTHVDENFGKKEMRSALYDGKAS